MSKISKRLFDEYNSSRTVVKESKKKHKKNINKIVNIIKPRLDKIYKNHKIGWNIESVDFCNDEYMKDTPIEYEWAKISENKYYDIKEKEGWKKFNSDESRVKEEYIYESEFEIIYYENRPVRHKYLRVYIHEYWGYGGNDDVIYDFLLTDIMDDVYLRKEKLEKLEEKV